ncbi:MAG: hypothetical protein KG003_08095 [Bacteroidetes bacterium]|nr:hypothetical protein [Bacteroidota bacterium]
MQETIKELGNDVENLDDMMFEVMNPETLKEMKDTELESIIIDLEYLYKEIVKPFYENQKNVISELIRRKGVDHYFQDEETGAVLKTSPKDGTFVSFFPYQIQRTRFSG